MSRAGPPATESARLGTLEETASLRTSREGSTTDVAAGEEVVVPVIEETARIVKRAVETGRVRVNTRTETVEQILRENLRGEAVGVTRVPINRELAAGEPAPQIRTEGSLTIIPVLEEILVVEKRLVLREEVHLQRTFSAEDVEVPVTLRRQHAEIEHVAIDGTVAPVPPSDPR